MTRPRLRRPAEFVDVEFADEFSDQMRERTLKSVLPRRFPELSPDEVSRVTRTWQKFVETPRRAKHRRRLFVAKFNPAAPDGGDPWIGENPDLWDPNRMSSWLDFAPYPNDRGGLWQKNVQPDAHLVAPGDLILVMRLAHEWSRDEPKQRRSDDTSPFRGEPVFLGVWWVVARDTKWFEVGKNRPSTTIWHMPLVRFDDADAVRITPLLSIEQSLKLAESLTRTNDWFVACKEGNEEAVLAAACSLPGDVFTHPDLPRLAARLERKRCGMRARDKKYWLDIRYRHEVRTTIHDTAIRRSEATLMNDGGWATWSMETVGRWGADLLAGRRVHGRRGGALDEFKAVEVKGTRYTRWKGKVMLEQSQMDRARRHATGQPLPSEHGEPWELHIQSGIPIDHDPGRDHLLSDLIVRDSEWVNTNWEPRWVHARKRVAR